METTPKRDWNIFISSVFFVLGFSFVFSLVGVLLQTVLFDISPTVQLWLARVGGIIIIFFGLFLLDVIKPAFLSRPHTIAVKHKFKSHFITSFIFGAAFAFGWTPCVSAALGAILTLASTSANSAFILLFAYTLGIGIPFLLVGFFTAQAKRFIEKAGPWLLYAQYFFGALLIFLGILMFTEKLSQVASFEFLVNILDRLQAATGIGEGITSLSIVNMGIAFLAGLGSFLSPCILPLVPGFLSYLASTAVKK